MYLPYNYVDSNILLILYVHYYFNMKTYLFYFRRCVLRVSRSNAYKI